ncbi:MAG: hypothetical protein AABZ55_16010, partial [Bdellovibrionota bacterium]
KAAELTGQIHPATKRRRFKKLQALLQKLSLAKHQSKIGMRVPVLIEGPSEETDLLLQGRMASQAQEIDGHILINDLGDLSADSLHAGDMIEVEITEALPHDLLGRAIRRYAGAEMTL